MLFFSHAAFWMLILLCTLKLVFVIMLSCRFRCKLTKLPWKWLTFRSFSTTGAMPLALWLEFLLMPRRRPPRLVAAASGATPLAAIRTLPARRVLTTALPVVVAVAGDAALPHHPVVVLAGPRLLLLLLGGTMLANGPAWRWRFLLRGLRRRLPLIPLLLLLRMTAGLCPSRPPIPPLIGDPMTKMILLPRLPLLLQPEGCFILFF